MGNCMEKRGSRLEDEEQETKGSEREKANGSGDVVVGKESNGLKVKVMLTKGELEWLVHHMRDDKGQKRRLEDLLMEMELGAKAPTSAADVDRAWKPTLESIMEVPEVQSFDATST